MHNQVDFSMMPDLQMQLICILRIVLSCLCGAAVGFERRKRFEVAGFRTHIIVALGSCLATIVSKYGFFDVVINESMQVDVSRISSNLLPSIAFLGAGLIFTRNGSIHGLTTATGIWATATVGFAIGSGLYLIGIVSTLIIVLVHSIFTKHYDSTSAAVIHMRYEKDEPLPDNLTEQIEQQFGCKVKAIYSKRTDSGNIHVNLVIHAKGNQNLEKLSIDLLKDPHYRAIDM